MAGSSLNDSLLGHVEPLLNEVSMSDDQCPMLINLYVKHRAAHRQIWKASSIGINSRCLVVMSKRCRTCIACRRGWGAVNGWACSIAGVHCGGTFMSLLSSEDGQSFRSRTQGKVRLSCVAYRSPPRAPR